MPKNFIARAITLTQREIDIINRYVQERNLGSKGFSAALRLIIQEWHNERYYTSMLSEELDDLTTQIAGATLD